LRELDRRFGSGTTGAWSKYRYGHLSPRPERLAVVEQTYPGTRRYFEAPLWRLLQPGYLGRIYPRSAFEWLRPPLRERFVIRHANEEAAFWRQPGNLRQDLQYLLDLSNQPGWSLDVGTGLAALLHEAVLLQDGARFADCFLAWVLYLEARQEHQVMMHIPAQLFDALIVHVLDHLSDHVPWLRRASTKGAKAISRLQKLQR